MRSYLNRLSTNKSERIVQEYYHKHGYKSIHRGFPDFCFYKENGKGKREYIFVEVKRSNQNSIKPAQRKMRNIFKRHGIAYKVAFGVFPDGSPNFKPYKTSGLQGVITRSKRNR